MSRRTTNAEVPLSKQIKKHVSHKIPHSEQEYEGNFNRVISTGSTLLNLAISGGRRRGGGLPGGILIEVFGPSSAGKTVLLSEIAGGVQRQGGDLMFNDPEGRLDEQFAKMFGFTIPKDNYFQPDTIPQVFSPIRSWNPESKSSKTIHGVFNDSLAALSTNMEMDNEEGDKMGGRRGKEFSEQLRKTCRIIKNKNFLVVCSNQIRENMNTMGMGPKTSPTGGRAIGFYASLRLQFNAPKKIMKEKKINGKTVKKAIGIETVVEVYKSSIWKPYRTAPLTIIFDYGVDDIRENLQFIKDYSGAGKVYTLDGQSLSNDMDKAIRMIEDDNLEKQLREEVIDLWMDIESKFETERKPKH